MLPYVQISRITDFGHRIRTEVVWLTIVRAMAAQHFVLGRRVSGNRLKFPARAQQLFYLCSGKMKMTL
jgi:hypothetical protein